ncbi:hypothetical protein Tcan_14516 [Toxocara canis]|uniref:Uncharacterized protein n=1 Tax=Toxocara canis TaxID=6265 RepID=A0A0B2UW88_TOXCA|nr:hypothetical protein Tcan_14516 [Toxocara canis]
MHKDSLMKEIFDFARSKRNESTALQTTRPYTLMHDPLTSPTVCFERSQRGDACLYTASSIMLPAQQARHTIALRRSPYLHLFGAEEGSLSTLEYSMQMCPQ